RHGDAHFELDACAALTVVDSVHDSGCLPGVSRPQHQHTCLVDGGADDVLVTRPRQHPELVTVWVARVDTKLARLTRGQLLILDWRDGRVLVRRDDRHVELYARTPAATGPDDDRPGC